MEFALTDRWSAKAEYMHYELAGESFLVGFHNDDKFNVNSSTEGDRVVVGLSYHFGR